MIVSFRSSHVHHQGSHHVVRIRWSPEIDRGGDRRSKAVDCAVWRVKRLDVVKIFGYRSHLDHAFSVVGSQTLNLSTTKVH
jgi:hypothetical protein